MTSTDETIRVCMLSAEVWPYAVAGGLSDVVAALPRALAAHGAEVKVFSPLHGSVRQHKGITKLMDLAPLRMGDREFPGALYVDASGECRRNYFIAQPDLFDRDGVYVDPETGETYPDDFERFNYFMRAALEAFPQLDWRPDVLHCHDSHTALIPAYLKLSRMGEPFYRRVSSVLTIHNLNYQGQYPREKYKLTGLPPELFDPLGPFEYYGKLNSLKAGICYADRITTVSPQYAREIQTPENGCGLHEVLRLRKTFLQGILNGIDTQSWNPEMDCLIEANFSLNDLSGKLVNKRHLQALCGFPPSDAPLIGLITRLPEQDGVDLFLDAAPALEGMDCQWLILGTGLRKHAAALQEWGRRQPDGFALHQGFSDRLAHSLFAGCDLFLMPARYEPCGLNQMYGMRYGAIPIVRHCGGLADTVVQYKPEEGSGQGFKFYAYESADLVRAIRQAVALWNENPEAWRRLIANAMSQDFSWERSAESYIEAYRLAVSHR